MTQYERFAQIFGELAADYIRRGDSDNAAILARRAAHNARIVQGGRGWLQRLLLAVRRLGGKRS